MTYIPVLIALVLFGYGAYVRMKSEAPVPKAPEQTAVLSVQASATPSASIAPAALPTASAPVTTPIPTSTLLTNVQWVYPGAQVVADNTYQTGTKGKEVFDWYKNQLPSAGFHIGVSVSSSANEVFKGVLQATKRGEILNIAIEQPEANQQTKITITYK